MNYFNATLVNAIVIIIASMYYDEIASQLFEMGFEKYNHFFDFKDIKSPILFSGEKYTCPFCLSSFNNLYPTGLKHKVLKEKEIIGGGFRINAICPECYSADRERLVYLYLKKLTTIFEREQNILHIAPEKNLSNVLYKIHNENYFTGDIDPSKAKYKIDLTNIPFKDIYFDFVICNHVLEHIPDDLLAMSEVYRVLKKGSKAILQVPISWKIEKTFEDFSIVSDVDREKYFGQADHVRIYGKDYIERLESVGFIVEVVTIESFLHKNEITKYALNPNEKIFLCSKE